MSGHWSLQRSDSVRLAGDPRWLVLLDRQAPPPEAEPPAELVAWARELNACPTQVPPSYGIVERSAVTNKVCPVYLCQKKFVDADSRGRWAVALGLEPGFGARVLSVKAADDLAQVLASKLHAHYGTEPEAPEPPPPPKPPTEAQIKAKKRDSAVREVACVLAGIKRVQLSQDEIRLADRIVTALEGVFT